MRLKLFKNKDYDQQREKHKAYLKNGFQLISQTQTKDGLIKRKYKRNKEEKINPWAIGLTKPEIRQLLWWACIGIARSKGGSYDKTIPELIEELAKKLKIQLPEKPEFNSRWKRYYANRKAKQKKEQK